MPDSPQQSQWPAQDVPTDGAYGAANGSASYASPNQPGVSSNRPNASRTQQPKKTSKNKKKPRRLLPALCNIFGTLILVAVIGICVPLTVPLIMGYEVYNVVSGSMEPTLPVGSAVYVKATDLENVPEGDIIAYRDVNSVIIHRVVINRSTLREFVTKGDANEIEDINPVPYDAVVGRMELNVPLLGTWMSIYASTLGKVYLLLAAACGVMLNIIASRMRESRRVKALQAELAEHIEAAAAADSLGTIGGTAGLGNTGSRAVTLETVASKKGNRRIGRVVRNAVIGLLAIAFLGSGGVIGYVQWQYSLSDALYAEAREAFTTYDTTPNNGWQTSVFEVAPIKVNFKKLQKVNPDVIGWIYCPDTVIDYPVLQGFNNDQYLHHDYTGEYNFSGSIFVDAGCGKEFSDPNSIIYGHNMNSGSMFASLSKWADQEYYEQHPVMWLLTPTRDYKIALFSGHHADALGSDYAIAHSPCLQTAALLTDAINNSEFKADVQLDSSVVDLAQQAATSASIAAASQNASQSGPDSAAAKLDVATVIKQATELADKTAGGNPDEKLQIDAQSHYVMLSTCAYLFETDRYVLNGKLIPLASAGGKELQQ